MNPLGTKNILSRLHNKRTRPNTNPCRQLSWIIELVHNKQLFILSGFIISEPDCTEFSEKSPGVLCTGALEAYKKRDGPCPVVDPERTSGMIASLCC